MSEFEDENTKKIIGNPLIAPETDSLIMQQHEVDNVTREEFTRDRNRKQTKNGQEFWLEVLRGHRDTASGRISRYVQKCTQQQKWQKREHNGEFSKYGENNNIATIANKAKHKAMRGLIKVGDTGKFGKYGEK